MPFSGTGVFNRLYSWAADAAAGLKISSSRMDAEFNGIATGLTNCMTRDGQSPATANIPMGGFKLTGLANATASTDALPYGQADGRYGLISTANTWAQAQTFSAQTNFSAQTKAATGAGGGYGFTGISAYYYMDANNGAVRVPVGGKFYAQDTALANVPIVAAAATSSGELVTLGQADGRYASSGANANITSLSGLTTPLSVAQGGTGKTSVDFAVGSYTTASLVNGGVDERSVAHGLGTDNIDFGMTIFGSSALPSGRSVSGTALGTDKRFMTVGSTNVFPSLPAAGNLRIAVINDTADQTITVNWWARKR